MKENIIKVIIADDHEIFRDGMRAMLRKSPDIALIAEAANGDELIKLARLLKPDVIITDIKMPEKNGIQATRLLSSELPETGIIALSMFDEEDLIVEMLEAGARGYLLKNAAKNEILEAIKAVNANQQYYCADTSLKLADMVAKTKAKPDYKTLSSEFSTKEITVMKLICREYTNRDIAEELGISKRTIEGIREKILEKTHAHNTAGIVIFAIANKIYEVDNHL